MEIQFTKICEQTHLWHTFVSDISSEILIEDISKCPVIRYDNNLKRHCLKPIGSINQLVERL